MLPIHAGAREHTDPLYERLREANGQERSWN
jgi:hypothetical protein